MGRRKQEPRNVHRGAIAAAAQILFMKKGIGATSMDDIARAAGYSKATLYAYFENKEEIIDVLALESMKLLKNYIGSALELGKGTEETYHLLCSAMLRYQEEFPCYFEMALDRIRFGAEEENGESRGEAYQTGEEINRMMEHFLTEGISAGRLRGNLELMPTIFSFWGMLSGLILIADKKKEYIQSCMKLSKPEFLEYGCSMLYRSIAVRGNGSVQNG